MRKKTCNNCGTPALNPNTRCCMACNNMNNWQEKLIPQPDPKPETIEMRVAYLEKQVAKLMWGKNKD
jgi:hypothetical protein